MDRYAAAVKFIFGNADYSSAAKRYADTKANKRRFDHILKCLNQPHTRFNTVHVAGTNGKGTTAAVTEAMIRATGARVGIFTSPHLHSFRERIRIDGAIVSREAVVHATDVVRHAVDEVGYASPFEKLTALAFVCFRDAGLEWAVLETGLGGRWDATNHCQPLACAITRVGYDHMNVLGDTIAQIASEKAGIIKPTVPVFVAPQENAAADVIRKAAAEVAAPITEVTEATADVVLRRLEADAGIPLPAWLAPSHQRLNAATAAQLFDSLVARDALSGRAEECARAALNLKWPCRFEAFTLPMLHGGHLILDVAHNEPAVSALVSSIDRLYPSRRVALILGANRDKDVSKILREWDGLGGGRLCARIAVASSHPKAIPAAEIVDMEATQGVATPWRAAASMRDALQAAAD